MRNIREDGQYHLYFQSTWNRSGWNEDRGGARGTGCEPVGPILCCFEWEGQLCEGVDARGRCTV